MVGLRSLAILLSFLAPINCFLIDLQASSQVGQDPEVNMDATELITSKGYPCENHWVTTEDGYILNLLRIPHGVNSNHTNKGPRPAILLQHGLIASATNFLTNHANQSLAYLLADAGADVWLGNSRGSTYSRNHTKLNPKHIKFWFFSWDDMAKYDLPATINYVRKVSGQDKIFYAGHSQGTTIAFAAFSENQQLASYIKHFFALAPVAQVYHAKSPLLRLSPLARNINVFINLLGHGEFIVPPKLMKFIATGVCAKHGKLCENLLFLFTGPDMSKSLNTTRLPVYLAHTPAPTSSRDVLQWTQQILSKRFQKYDYGTMVHNFLHYGKMRPPQYEPSKMKVPVSLYTGGQDWLADPQDVAWLKPQVNVTQHIDVDFYNHMDLVWAMDAASRIYSHIVKAVMA